MSNIQKLKQHVAKCPIGWHQGKLNRTRSTTDQDVIEWITRLEEITALLEQEKQCHCGQPEEPHTPRAGCV